MSASWKWATGTLGLVLLVGMLVNRVSVAGDDSSSDDGELKSGQDAVWAHESVFLELVF